jgi:hypothetical protein
VTSTSLRASLGRVAVATLVLAPVLAACGFNEQTDQVYQPAVGVDNRDGQINVLDALIVSGTNGTGTFVASLVNTNQAHNDELESISGAGITATDVTTPIAANAAVNLADAGKIAISGAGVKAGYFVPITLVFANGQSTSITVPVVANDNEFAKVPLPSATPSDTPSATSTATPTN